MNEALVSEFEVAIADAGALLVRAQKYRRGAGPAGTALMQQALALGDAARRLHREAALDDAAVRPLLDEARALAGRLCTLLAEVRGAPEYRAAVAAHGAGDTATLARALPAVFAGLEAVPAPGDLFVALPWLRRGRLRPVADVLADVLAVRREGLAAEGDDLSPGADADLPAVVLMAESPADEPIVLRLAAGSVPPPVHRLVETGEHLVHAPRLRVEPAVRLAAALHLGEQLRVEIAPADYTAYRADLDAALRREGISVEDT
jgi:hypothetical protein